MFVKVKIPGLAAATAGMMFCLPSSSALLAAPARVEQNSPFAEKYTNQVGLKNPRLRPFPAGSDNESPASHDTQTASSQLRSPFDLSPGADRGTTGAQRLEWHLLKADEQVTLYTTSCDQLFRLINALDSWRRNLSESGAPARVISPSIRFAGNDKYCAAQVSSILPKRVLRVLNMHTVYDGANSWTAVLYAQGLIDSIRAVDSEEFHHYASLPSVCRPVQTGQPEPGDIGIVRVHSADGSLHEKNAFIYLGPEMVFTKDSVDHELPFAVENSHYFLHLNGLLDAPSRCLRGIDADSEGCQSKIVYRRCSLRAANPKPSSPTLEASVVEAKQLEDELEPITLGFKAAIGASDAQYFFARQQRLLQVVVNSSEKLASRPNLDVNKWNSFTRNYLRVLGLAYQIASVTSNQRLIATEVIIYPFDTWQGVVLRPPENSHPGAQWQRIDCSPWSRDKTLCP